MVGITAYALGMSIEGRVALVTGSGGQGMGRSIALTLAREGADIVVNYRKNRGPAEEVVAAIVGMGRRAIALAADAGESGEVEAMFARAIEALGQVDIVVNSAGGPWKPQDVTEIEPGHLRRVIAGEIEATYYLLRAGLPGMRERGWGRFISIGGHMADDWRFGPPEAPLDYPMGKAVRHWLTRTLAPREFSRGITINAIAPGPTARFSAEEALAAVRKELARPQPPAGAGSPPGSSENTPQDIAEIAAFLCSDAAARITGAVIPVPGARPV